MWLCLSFVTPASMWLMATLHSTLHSYWIPHYHYTVAALLITLYTVIHLDIQSWPYCTLAILHAGHTLGRCHSSSVYWRETRDHCSQQQFFTEISSVNFTDLSVLSATLELFTRKLQWNVLFCTLSLQNKLCICNWKEAIKPYWTNRQTVAQGYTSAVLCV